MTKPNLTQEQADRIFELLKKERFEVDYPSGAIVVTVEDIETILNKAVNAIPKDGLQTEGHDRTITVNGCGPHAATIYIRDCFDAELFLGMDLTKDMIKTHIEHCQKVLTYLENQE